MARKKPSDSSSPNIFKSALGMGLGTLVSRILGFLRDAVIMSLFPRYVREAYVIGFRLPNIFRRVLGEGALSVSFIPTYIELLKKDNQDAAKLKNTIFSFLSLISGLLFILGLIFMEPLLAAVLSGEGRIKPGTEDFYFALKFAKWMFGYLFVVTQFAFFMSVLNAHKKFWIPGVAPALLNLGILIFAFLPNEYFSFSGHQLAVGVLFGGFFQAALVMYITYKNHGLPKLNFDFSFAPFLEVLKKTIPSLMAIGVFQLISIINIRLTNETGIDGGQTAIYLADRILELPQSLIAVSLGTAMLPNLADIWISNKEKFNGLISQSIKLFLFFALPAAIGIWFLREQIIQILFQWGKFSAEDVSLVVPIVQVYAVMLLASGLSRVFLPAYYAIKNTWFPAVCAVLVVTCHYFLGTALIQDYGLKGVAITTLVSAAINLVLLNIGLGYFIKAYFVKDILSALLKFFPPCAALIGFLYFFTPYIPPEKSILSVSLTFLCIGISVALYFTLAFLLKIEEGKNILKLIKRKT